MERDSNPYLNANNLVNTQDNVNLLSTNMTQEDIN